MEIVEFFVAFVAGSAIALAGYWLGLKHGRRGRDGHS